MRGQPFHSRLPYHSEGLRLSADQGHPLTRQSLIDRTALDEGRLEIHVIATACSGSKVIAVWISTVPGPSAIGHRMSGMTATSNNSVM